MNDKPRDSSRDPSPRHQDSIRPVAGHGGPFAIRGLRPNEADEADKLFRMAFGTFLGLPDPLAFRPGASIFAHRLAMYPEGVFALEQDGRLVGAAVANRWGKVGVVGPVVVAPSHWKHGVGRVLIDHVLERLAEWGCSAMRLATFPHSTGHIRLYQGYGFWPAFLSASMVLPCDAFTPDSALRSRVELLSQLSAENASRRLRACAELAGNAEPGLDLTSECQLMRAGAAGEVLLLTSERGLDGFAVCAAGNGTEGGDGNCMIKAAVATAPPASADVALTDLVKAACGYASDRGLSKLMLTLNTRDLDTYKAMLALGFVTATHQIIMDRPPRPTDRPRPACHVLLDLR